MKATLRCVVRWLNASLLRQLAALLIGLALLVTLCVGMVSRFLYTEEIVRIAAEAQQVHLSAQKANLDRMMKDYAYVLFEMAVDAELLAVAQEMCDASERLPAYREHWMREKLGTYTSYRRELVAVALWSMSGNLVVFDRTGDSTTGRRGIWQGEHQDAMMRSCELALHSGAMQVLPTGSEANERRFLHLFFPIRDLYTRRNFGVLALSLDQANLMRILADQPTHARSMLLNRDGLIISHPGGSLLGQPALLPDGRDIVQETPLERMGLRLVSIIDRGGLLDKALGETRWMQVAVAGVCLLVLAASYILLRRTHRAFRVLLGAIAQVRQGNDTVRARIRGQNELGIIAGHLNDMLDRLAASAEERQQRMKQSMAAIEKQHIAQIAALEAQIDAHFLYNTLGSIHHEAEKAGNGGVAEQIQMLADILRYTFEKSNRVVTAQEEMHWLEKYLTLQRKRFGEKFAVHTYLDPKVAGWPLRKLIVQPFVENAIIHGLQELRRGGCLRLEMRPFHDRYLRVVIADNGAGMSPDTLMALRELFGSEEMPTRVVGGGIGLENAYARIRTYYHGNARVIVRSWPGKGTRVVVLLPHLQG